MITQFATWLWEQLPSFWHDNDTNKDSNGQGTAERLLECMGLELDEEVVAKIDDYLELLDAQLAPEDFLDHIADCLGNPPDVFGDVTKYRNLLSYIVSVYKIKGTAQGYEVFYNLLGFSVTITEYTNVSGLYDNSVFFDQPDTTEIQNYDTTECEPCSDYEIVFTAQFPDTSSPDPLDGGALEKLADAVNFVEPINANLIFTQYLIPITDIFDLVFSEVIEVFTITSLDYDGTVETMDNSEYYDNPDEELVFSYGLTSLGVIMYNDFGVDLLTEWTEVNTDGTLAYNLSGGYLQITGDPAAWDPADAFLRHDWITAIENWTLEVTYTVGTKDTVDEGVIIGWEPEANCLSDAHRVVFIHYRKNGSFNDGDIFYAYNDGTPTMVESSPSGVVDNGDQFKLTLEKTYNSLTCTVENITDPETIYEVVSYDLSDSGTDLFLSTGHPIIGSAGGDTSIKTISFTSPDYRNIENGYLVIGDGTFQGYESSSDANRIISKLRAAHPDMAFTLEAGVGDTSTTHLAKTPDVMFLHNASKVIIMANPDDIITNGLATVLSDYSSLISWFSANGVTEIIHVECLPQAGNTDINSFNTFLAANYSGGIHTVVEINATFNDGSNDMDATYSDDGRYPNDAGQTIIFNAINAEI